MPTDTHLISSRIRDIRKSKHLRTKDCAKALGVSKETYRNFEKGLSPISLPELELIAFYLGVTPTALIENNQGFTAFSNLLHEDIRPQYLTLRRKMVGAMISAAREVQAVSVEDLKQATQIPADRLYAYEKGDIPIPLSDLFLISDYLEISYKALFATVWLDESSDGYPWQENKNPQDFSNADSAPDDDVFSVLLHAIKQMSSSEQAQIAKIILEKLRT